MQIFKTPALHNVAKIFDKSGETNKTNVIFFIF